MPRSKFGIKRPGPNKDALEAAAKEVLENKMSFRAAASQYNVSRSTLMRHIKEYRNSGKNKFEYRTNYETQRVFTKEEELLLVQYLKQAARLHYGLSLIEVRKLAYQYAKQNLKKFPTSWNLKEMAGK